ncbi:hypothetical protein ACHAXR_010408 [Thalassiosira sp. AJA248-18]
MMKLSLIAAFLCAIVLGSAQAFLASNNGSSSALRKSSSLHMTVLTANGKKIDIKEGTPLKAACAKLGVKPKYSCKKGDCGSCTVSVGGSRIKACVGKVPPMPKLKSLQEKGLVVK